MVYSDLIIFILSLISIVAGAELLVNSASKIAKFFGTTDFVIGLTLVAIGTSLPELSIAISASLKKESIITLGNLVGASITNLGLILGITAIVYTIRIDSLIFRRDSWMLLISTLVFIIFALDQSISVIEGVILLLLFGYYLYDLSRNKVVTEKIEYHEEKHQYKEVVYTNMNLPKQIILAIVGLGFLYIGARYLIPSTVNIANFYHFPEEIIALSLISIGTTLPELTVSIVAARKGMINLVMGNLIGSNITNLLLVVGLASIINPISISNLILYYMLPYLLIITILFIMFSRSNWLYRVLQGYALLFVYIAYVITLAILRFN